MSVFAILAAEDPSQSHHWLFPEKAEMLYGIPAALLVIFMLVKFAGPAVKKAMADRTARIQAELDRAAEAQAASQTEATDIREAKGDIDAERQRLFAEADAQAEAALNDGRARLDAEVAELEARAEADLAGLAGRSSDEMRGQIVRLSSDAVDRVVTDSLDTATQQELIEAFIAKVGAS